MPGENDRLLEELADAYGIVGEYLDQTGTETRLTSSDTRRAFLAAMGVDASTDARVRESLAELREADRRRRIDAVRVVRVDDVSARTLRVRGSSGDRWKLEVRSETGETDTISGRCDADGSQDLTLPRALPPGYYDLRLVMDDGASEAVHEQRLIVVPPRCVTPSDLLGDGGRTFGITANLYTIRSGTNWGIGDFTDLGELAAWAGENGADFVGVNPLHALLNRGIDISPYGPLTRLFRNPIYIDVTHVPELGYTPELCERIGSPEFLSGLEPLRESTSVRYEQVMAVKGIALDALHRVFMDQVRGSREPRDRAYERFIAEQGAPLERFALWMAIMEQQGTNDWRRWPSELRSPRSGTVEQFARDHATRIEFHRWVQFEADRQLADAAERGRDTGMRIGLYQDLAIGVSPAGADAWSFADLFARGVSIGAPPDPYAATGQNWGLPPIDPRALARTGYRYFVDTVRSAFRHAGALRIDHVLGFFRLFWIPEGEPALSGAYVRYPANDLLGILALESARHQAIVVGEDLGTVPDEVGPALARWGVLSSKVMQFERERDGGYKSPATYPALSLATADTHDMAPITGFWEGRDIDTRVKVGLIPDEAAAQVARESRERERQALIDRLAEDDVLPFPVAPASPADLRGAVHELLCRSPAQLVGLALDDLAGELDAVNVPGVGPDTHPSWMRKMRQPLEVIMMSDDTRAAMCCGSRGRAPGTPAADD